MKKHIIFHFVFLFGFSFQTWAQEIPKELENILSPEIHANKTVTFRLWAPLADSVKLVSDLLPPVKEMTRFGVQDGPGNVLMKKDDRGLWTFTTNKLESELYSYWFLIDGARSTDPNNPYAFRNGASLTNILIIPGLEGDLYSVKKVPHGSVTHTWYHSPYLKTERRVSIYTPNGYETSDKRYPVLYLLHGAGGDEDSWMAHGRAVQILDNLIAAGKAEPMIVVMPNGNVSQDAGYGQGNYGLVKPEFLPPRSMNGEFEAHFKDLVDFVDKSYRTRANKANRAIAGLSMGGFHTMHISRYYPDLFNYVGLFSAGILPREDATGKVYLELDETLRIQKEKGVKLYWIAIGRSDFLYDANVEYRAKLDELEFNHEYLESPEGHIWKNWRIYLGEFAPKLFK